MSGLVIRAPSIASNFGSSSGSGAGAPRAGNGGIRPPGGSPCHRRLRKAYSRRYSRKNRKSRKRR